ncbi:phenylacrylic acid decarboxylase [Metarhizium guizhouense ARSEF 977]|uniref:Phenylacrylic acid decarboxylase n=1 Tax=Metarhizium guizhouense (strain ARSEF 977) TaxID=1276136 RepID=A0A0B4GR43_METGA|nr:phenylacrylic acid decarboxylase [Metarhizium guizhouense ARSEF 977]
MRAVTVNNEEADRVLRQKRRARGPSACYPCKKRKVKCDGSVPCQTCRKRQHPQICTYDLSMHPQRASMAASVQDDTTRSALPVGPGEAGRVSSEPSSLPDENSKNYVYSGDNSFVSILGSRASGANDSVAGELTSVLGLQNTFDIYPFMDSKTPHDRWKLLLAVLPQRAEVLKFFHCYRATVYPFNPIIVDIDQFESDLCTYLSAHAAGELHDPGKISDCWATNKSIGYTSLLLATLAAGSHYSDVEYPHRQELSIDFASRSFQALRLANFLFRPSLDTIQALLILGNTLQNMGQSDSAWAMLGTTVRLAQAMGLHAQRNTVRWPECIRTRARALWSTIVWQDSLLSLCYDRPPIVSVTEWPLDDSFFQRQNLSYTEIMHFICRLNLDIMRPEALPVAEVNRAIESLQQFDGVYQRGQPYLRAWENCTTIQQHLEHLALRMHSSFFISVLCRPAIKTSLAQPPLPHTDILRTRAKASLIDASKAFLDFQALSVIPLRSWSMVHTVLSSTLLLCAWEETRNDPECRGLQQRVIDVFSLSDSTAGDGALLSDNNREWLSARHIRALVKLRNALDREEGISTTGNENWAGLGVNAISPLGTVPDGYLDILDPAAISPVTYLNSVLNVSLFDFS